MTTTFTTHFRFGLPDFLSGPWHADWYALVIKIDELLFDTLLSTITTVWANSTAYLPGNFVVSPEDGTFWTCNVAHTSAASPTLFSADRVAHPTFWTAFGIGTDLTAIEALATFGIAVRTADGVWATRTLVPPVAGLTITNPAGISGNITLTLANDLATLEALASTGFPARTATDTWALRTWQAPAAGILITNPAGIAGDPAIALANDLSAVEGLASTGLAARTASDTWAVRTMQAPVAGFSITNPAGIAGDPTFVLTNDLGAIEALNANAILVRTGTDTWAVRTITGPAAGITVSNGSGVSGNPTLALANDLAALEALASSGFAERTGTDTWQITGFTGTGNVVRDTSPTLVTPALGTPSSGSLLNTSGYPESIVIAVGDETTPVTATTGKVAFRMPYAFTLTGVRASLTTAQTSGSIFTVDINESGTTVISTKLTIDNTEKTSTTAATPAVISDSSLADDAEITIDVDQIGDGTAKGLKVTLLGRR
jgi:hypothetical protein